MHPGTPGSRSRASAHIPALDGIRGAAAAAVFIYHYGGGARSTNPALHFLGEAVHLGWVGVSLFFVLSGFLITGILLDSLHRPGWWRGFYLRRTLRIFPLYYVALLGGVLGLLLLGVQRTAILPVWPFFLYLQDIPGMVRFGNLSPLFGLGHFWSLAVEEQFYLVWPFLLAVAARRGRVRELCLVVCLLSLIFRTCVFGFHLNWQWAGYFIGGRAGEMAAGGFLASSLRHIHRNEVFRWARPVLALSFAGAMTIIITTNQTSAGEPWFGTLGILFLSGLFTSMIALALQPGRIQQAFEFSFLRWLGKISYGIYVYHLLLYPVFAWLTSKMLTSAVGETYQLLLLGAVAIAGTLLAASLSFVTFESAFLKLKDAIGKPEPQPVLR